MRTRYGNNTKFASATGKQQ